MAKNMYNSKYKFEWDEKKNLANIAKHGISFHEAQEAFRDERRVIEDDSAHSDSEDRFYCLGYVNGRVATVRFTMRHKRIRIIGAGHWRDGRKRYERKNRRTDI